MDWGLHRERNVVERLVGKLKECRRIATVESGALDRQSGGQLASST
jgi:hypothetical protein